MKVPQHIIRGQFLDEGRELGSRGDIDRKRNFRNLCARIDAPFLDLRKQIEG